MSLLQDVLGLSYPGLSEPSLVWFILLLASWQGMQDWPTSQWWMACIAALPAIRWIWSLRTSKGTDTSFHVKPAVLVTSEAEQSSAGARSWLYDNILAESSGAVKNIQDELASGASQAWMDCGEPGKIDCHLRVDRTSRKQATSTVVIDVHNTANQIPDGLSLIGVHRENASHPKTGSSETARLSGALVMILDPTRWPQFVPLLKEVVVIHAWGDREYLLRANFNIRFFSLECYVYVQIVDHLDSDGSVGVIIAGVPRMRQAAAATGAAHLCEDGKLLGIPLPQNEGAWSVCVPVEVDYACKTVWPGADGKHHKCRFVLNTDEPCPSDWMVKWVFSAVASRVMPLLAKSVAEDEAQAKGGASIAEMSSCDRAALDSKVQLFESLLRRMH